MEHGSRRPPSGWRDEREKAVTEAAGQSLDGRRVVSCIAVLKARLEAAARHQRKHLERVGATPRGACQGPLGSGAKRKSREPATHLVELPEVVEEQPCGGGSRRAGGAASAAQVAQHAVAQPAVGDARSCSLTAVERSGRVPAADPPRASTG